MLEELYQSAQSRKEQPKEGSYTNYLFEKGIDKILKKVGEEATEVVIAAKNADKVEMANEVADLLYHLAVMLVETNVTTEDVQAVLKERHGKKSRIQDRKEVTDY
ncbi:phosphoribosyl-ATP diphosphatase [Streptococcus moroccensis]|nr:phosphoribosyl-ATP diphosphatase [Streptococcus moroccensis]